MRAAGEWKLSTPRLRSASFSLAVTGMSMKPVVNRIARGVTPTRRAGMNNHGGQPGVAQPCNLAACCSCSSCALPWAALAPPRSTSGRLGRRLRRSRPPPRSRLRTRPTGAGGTVRSFGPVPQCGDEAATAAVLGLLRAKVADRTLGLANVHVAGHSQIGDLEAWACEADVPGGRRRAAHPLPGQPADGRARAVGGHGVGAVRARRGSLISRPAFPI